MKYSLICLAVAISALSTGCATTDMVLGGSKNNTSSGSAAGGSASGEKSNLAKCASSLGTISLVENQDAGWYSILRNEYRLPPTGNLLRLIIQQSNCFVVVERGGAGMRAMERERALMGSGEMRGGSNYGKGQVVASDYGLSPEIMFNESDAGAIGGAIGGILGGIIGGIKSKEATTMLTLVDNRSGVQVAVSQGSASKMDFGLGGLLGGGGVGGALGGYSKTSQGKVIAAAFVDAYNNMVTGLKGYKAQSVQGQGLGGGGRLGVDGSAAPSQTSAGSARATPTQIRQAQTILNKLGYKAGSADGMLGKGTMNAVRQFQRDRGLPVNGRLDATTLRELSN